MTAESGRRGREGPGMLVHLVDRPTWRSACALGAVTPRSLVAEGVVRLTTADEVQRLAASWSPGRHDVVVLVVDPARLPAETRPATADEAPVGTVDLHGPLPTRAVVATQTLRWSPDGAVEPLGDLPGPDDVAGRVRTAAYDSAVGRAPIVVTVPGGAVTLDPRLPGSYDSNALRLLDELPVSTVLEHVDHWLGAAGLPYRRVVVERDETALVAALGARGWQHQALVTMAATGPVPGADDRVVELSREQAERWWAAQWRSDLPGVDDATVAQLVERERLVHVAHETTDLGVVVDGEVAASTQLRLDGACAEVTAVMTGERHRGRGHASALLRTARARAAAAGADLVWLDADAEDWPRQWYERSGFAVVGARHELHLDG